MDLRNYKKILVYGGSFDPPHLAHATLPELVRQHINADITVYIPAAQHPLKTDQPLTPAHHRLAMLQLALSEIPNTVVLQNELNRAAAQPTNTTAPPTPTYTVDTLEELRHTIGPNPEMRLLIGGDCLKEFDRWHKPNKIIELAEPIVMVRPLDSRESLLAGLPGRYVTEDWERRLVDVPVMDVSSTEVRRRVAAGLSLEGLVAPAVVKYMRGHGLYR